MTEYIKDFGWNSIAQAYKVLFSSLILIVLARLIPVEAFGVIGMATVFVLFFNTLLNIGFDSSIIYSKTLKEGDLFSLFVLNIGVGLLIYGIGYMIAPLLSLFYDNNEIQIIFRALILSVVLASAGVVSKGYLQKKLEFKKLAIVDLISITLAGMVALAVAMNGYGYWALIWQQLLTVGLISIGYLSISYKSIFKSFVFSFGVLKEHLRFGYNVLIFNLSNFFAQQLDVLLIGKFLGERELGIYMLAFNLIIKPISLLVQVFNKTLYPILTGLKFELVSHKYAQYTYRFFIIFAPLIIIGVSLSQIVIPYLLTDKWISTLPLLIVFGYQAIRMILASPSGLLFLISGNPDKQWKFSIYISLPLRLAGIFMGYLMFKSSLGITIGINFFATIEMLAGFYLTFRLIKLDIKSYFFQFRKEFIEFIVLVSLLIILNSNLDDFIVLLSLQVLLFLAYELFKWKKQIKRLRIFKTDK